MHSHSTFPNLSESIPVESPADKWQVLLPYLLGAMKRFLTFVLGLRFTIMVYLFTDIYQLHITEIIGATLIFWCVIFLLADLMGLEEVEGGAGRGVLKPINHPHESR